MWFKVIAILMLLEITGELHEIENKSEFEGKLFLQDFLIVNAWSLYGYHAHHRFFGLKYLAQLESFSERNASGI